jgi:GTP-binding protein LepA
LIYRIPDREKSAEELISVFGFKEEEILYASGKTGEGVDEILQAIVNRVPAPQGQD